MQTFLSTLPARGATSDFAEKFAERMISIHAPREGSDLGCTFLIGAMVAISIHAPREGSDCRTWYMDLSNGRFLSTLPARGATSPASIRPVSQRNFYPRSPRGERPALAADKTIHTAISIHAPREGSDDPHGRLQHHRRTISIHAPREGSDCSMCSCCARPNNFYPRSPRGERQRKSRAFCGRFYFYPRSPRGERQVRPLPPIVMEDISIHAPREGSDISGLQPPVLRVQFLSTLPARGATDYDSDTGFWHWISIHAPREGSDVHSFIRHGSAAEFLSTLPARGATPWAMPSASETISISIHAPREGSDSILLNCRMNRKLFLSTLPARGATRRAALRRQIHRHFYPRSPRGERHAKALAASNTPYFYPRSPRGERRLWSVRNLDIAAPNFYPRSPRGERLFLFCF